MSITNVINRRYQLQTPPGEEIPAGCYVATDLVTRESVAVKLASFGDPAADRLQREENFLKGIRHPSIVQTYEAGRSLDRKQYVVFEHLKAKPLSSIVKESGPLSGERLIGIIDQLASAIDACHAQDIIHGAICPDHVLVYIDQLGIERCKLTEFGYAVHAHDALRVGPPEPRMHPAPAYMSPEQANSRPVTTSTDVYSLAAVVYFAWTGKPPFSGTSAEEIAAAKMNTSPPRISERARHLQLSQEIDSVMISALDRRAGTRPRSAMALADAIRNGFSRQVGGVEGLVAAAQGESPAKRVSVRSSAPTAVIRPAGGRVQPAPSGPAAFVAPGTDPAKFARPTEPSTTYVPNQAIIPGPVKGASLAEFRLIALSVLLAAGLLWLTFTFG